MRVLCRGQERDGSVTRFLRSHAHRLQMRVRLFRDLRRQLVRSVLTGRASAADCPSDGTSRVQASAPVAPPSSSHASRCATCPTISSSRDSRRMGCVIGQLGFGAQVIGTSQGFRASCERPVATWSVISAWAARMPAASRECSHALEEAKSAHTQCHPPPDSKKTRKRSIKYSLRTSEPRRPGFSTPMSSKSPSAYLKASAKQCWYVCTPPHRHARRWTPRRNSRGTADVRSLRKPDHKSPIFVPKLHARALEAGT